MYRRDQRVGDILIMLACAGIGAFGQVAITSAASFRNLDFEMAAIASASPGLVPESIGIPNWSSNNWESGYVLYDLMTLDSVCVSIHDVRGGSPIYGPFKPFQGRYSLMLQTSSPISESVYLPVFISQVGDIPDYAKTLAFSTDLCRGGSLVLSLNGVTMPTFLDSVSDTPDANNRYVQTYVADIRAFTGQHDVELKFELSAARDWNSTFGARQSLDDIVFLSEAVPEPSSLVLLAVAALATSAFISRRRQVLRS
jgi:hypothetical protein